MIGVCRLCHQDGRQLIDGHIIPRWAYRRARTWTHSEGKDPLHVGDGRAYKTSSQISEHMLCRDCEDHFARAEKYVSQLTYRSDGTSRLFDDAIACGPRLMPNGLRMVEVASLNREYLVRFAASVVWRAGVMKTRQLGVRLGPYAEVLREYLNSECALPREVAITLQLLDVSDPRTRNFAALITFPKTTRIDEHYSHRFLLHGLHFDVSVGRRLPAGLRHFCLLHSGRGTVVIGLSGDFGLVEGALEQLEEAYVPPNVGSAFVRPPRGRRR